MSHERMARGALFASTALALTLAVPEAAFAQAAGPAEEAQTAADDGSSLTQDIVVTARRREERVQDAPVSVTSLSGEALTARGINSPVTLGQITPGLNIVASGAYSQPVIRGISSTNVTVGDEANVAIYVDGVYMAQMSSNFFKFNNVERIEVLKGPQGTLFGRNATGGAISVITKTPSHEASGSASVSYGRFNTLEASGYVTGGLSDKAALDLAVVRYSDDGYVRHIVTGKKLGYQKFTGVRSKLLLEPSDTVTLTLSGDYTSADNITTLSSAPLAGNTATRVTFPNDPIPTRPYQSNVSVDPQSKVDAYGTSFKGEIDLGFARLLSLTAYRHETNKPVTDTDGGFANISSSFSRSPSSTWTQELQLSSQPSSPVQWVVGAYGFDSKVEYDPLLIFPANTRILSTIKTKAIAGFGEATVSPIEHLSLTAGVRYSSEKKTNFGSINGGARGPFTETWSSFTPRAIVKYEIPGVLNIYGSFSRGFKSGQFNSAALNGSSVTPENVNAYEVGVKTLMPGPFRATIAAFQYDYDDLQVSSRVPGGTVTQLNNAAKARIKGFEATVDTRLGDRLNIGAGITYLDAKYNDFPIANVTIPRTTNDPVAPANLCVAGTGTPVGGNRQLICDVSGNRLIRAPKLTANLNFSYRQPLASGVFDVSGNLFYSDSFFWDPFNRISQPSYTVINGQVGYTLANGTTRVSVWGENLTDEVYELTVSTSALADYVNYARPRAYGVRVSQQF